ncbi:class I SAM-dependent methyltransferase [Oceanivirga salmonicida]|uniref:class I SAM-dependent methyltransferase n=1 Tax=Oceanivirga salmonicida TaxID=1769291 RepID=UPI00083664CA|nr:class I SAM-dependent methyltransferase [Oceanivirga salmonicida]
MSLNSIIKSFWENESDVYRKCIQGELDNFKKNEWYKILKEDIPKNSKVLDIGTGPGFFAMLLYDMGCDVTAIDITNNMIKEAKILCKNKDKINFMTMDSHKTTFDDNSFDILICRNVTWTLDNPPIAYREWYRILKPNGKLIIFDANFNLRYFNSEIEETYQKNLKIAKEKGYFLETHNNQELEDELSKKLFLSNKIRPQWDLNEMLDIGFSKFLVDTKFDENLLTEKDKLFWGHAPSFKIIATK